MPIEPSVTMNGSIRARVMSSPLVSPASSPTSRATPMPARTSGMPIPRVGSSAFMTRIIIPAMKAAIEPTERSSPPAVMTKVIPTAMMPMKAERESTLVMFPADRKFGVQKRAQTGSARSAPEVQASIVPMRPFEHPHPSFHVVPITAHGGAR